jgi:spermidine synthase
VPLAFVYLAAARHRWVFAVALVAVMLGSYKYLNDGASTLTTQRNFFGVWSVTAESGGRFHRIRHGSTTHGGQFTDPSRRCEATSYFHKDGPLGQAFQAHNSQPARSNRVASIGLGAGTIVTYSSSGESWDIYEIDPAIVGIASDTRYFRFLSDCSAAPHRIILGDARLRLKEAGDAQYSMLILDAFSSDSVPAHLLTREALNLYLSKLTEDGILAAHITNRYLNLEPVFSGLTSDAGLAAFIRADNEFNLDARKYPSTWIVVSRRAESLERLASDARWRPLRGAVVWTDDFSNILDLMK